MKHGQNTWQNLATLFSGALMILTLGAAPSRADHHSSAQMHGQQPHGQKGHGGPHHRRHPPQKALEACQGKAKGEACQFTGRGGHTVSGTCFQPHADKPLACKPSRH